MKKLDVIQSSVIVIEKKFLSYQEINKIKYDLTVEEYDFDNNLSIKHFFKESEDLLFVPKFYKNENIEFNIIKNLCSEGEDINIEWNKDFELREDKQSIIDIIKNHNNGLIKLPTGFGKTILSIHYISLMKKKTLIIVDREVLLDQWKKSILNSTNLKEEDIGIIKGDKMQFDKPVIIAMVQTLVSKYKNSNEVMIKKFKESNIGISIIDEVHSIVGPISTSEIIYMLFSKTTFGLSATPYRNSKKENIIMNYCIGDLLVDKVNEIIPLVKTITFTNNLPNKTYNYMSFGGKFNYMKYTKQIYLHDEKFVHMVLDIITETISKSIHKILVPISIIDAIDKIIHTIDTNDKYINLRDKYIKLTSSTKNNFDDSKQIIFATSGLISKGYDNPSIETLLLTIPIGSNKVFLTQLVGRILRSKKDKNNMMIIDMVDEKYYETRSAYNSRLKNYKLFGYQIIEDDTALENL